jgi:aminoglycoside phosphotransferase (APT) family kinase protein
VELVALTSGLFHEPRLFTSGVVLPLDHPAVYTAIIDEEGSDFLMIMEDVVARGADPRDSTRPMTVDQAASGVRGLAKLHSEYWGDRITDNPALGWVEPFIPFAGLEYAPLEIAHERLGDSVPAEIPAMTGTDLFVDIWARYIRTLTAAPQTLLHGDPHIGNTYVLPDDTVGFLDWQMVRRGNFSLDLGYFLQGALSIEDRRRHERDLLGEYRSALSLPNDEIPTADEIWLRYRASVAHGLAIWIATLSGGDAWQRPEICLAFAQRYAAAFVDLDTRAALDSITA